MKRNGKIELLRFVFCVVVVLYHINLDIWDGKLTFGENFSFFLHGRTCVEFFFLLSGFLMARSVHKNPKPDTLSVGQDTFNYLVKKVKGVWIPYLLFSVAMIAYIPFGFEKPVEYAADRLPSLLFLQRSGMADEGFISVSWYLSSLFIAIIIIYPFLRRFYDSVSLVAAPLISVLIMGALIHETGHLPQRAFDGFIHLSNLRGVAVVLLGVFTYRVCLCISKAEISSGAWRVLGAGENLLWFVTLGYLVSQQSEKYEGHVTLIMAAAIAISFARRDESRLFNNRFVAYLGRISLPVYLAQSLVRTVVNGQFDYLNDWVRALLILIFTLFLGVIADRITMIIKYRKKS